ncbi:hypothetical protein BOX15_Mlig026894g2 [Macrostomum lignano]|uniref:Uncharacterized protein n=1 Tax=Macrostomum lignano TaxID=282301 RepID=A0A267GTN4_9PLAT|nr:hypothetical protein BOX15_Mlig026894g2 [Macrostomum lignano]
MFLRSLPSQSLWPSQGLCVIKSSRFSVGSARNCGLERGLFSSQCQEKLDELICHQIFLENFTEV